MTAADEAADTDPDRSARLTEFAPAKVNLYLHLRGRRADGYHLLDSLAVFPAVGDRLSAAPGAAPGSALGTAPGAAPGSAPGRAGQGLTLSTGGPFGAALGPGGDNLVLRAARALAGVQGITPDLALHLDKHLPLASGIGGGSSDAAAALRLLARLWGVTVPAELAAGLGADVPVCLAAPAPQLMAGIGERLSPAPDLPPFWIVLANPGVAVETQAVFAALTRRDCPPPDPPPPLTDFAALRAWLAAQRNDLQPAAAALCPAIPRVLAALAPAPLARMSGSGATCFALWPTEAEAKAQAAALIRAHPAWWIVAAEVAPPPPSQP